MGTFFNFLGFLLLFIHNFSCCWCLNSLTFDILHYHIFQFLKILNILILFPKSIKSIIKTNTSLSLERKLIYSVLIWLIGSQLIFETGNITNKCCSSVIDLFINIILVSLEIDYNECKNSFALNCLSY